MLLAWIFVLTPLVLYVAAYLVETVMSFARLRNHKTRHSYLDATWEVTHTFLVMSIAFFANLFSHNLREIASAAFIGIFTAACFIAVRGLLYMYLFYVRPDNKRGARNWADWAFALSHIGILVGVAILLLQLVPALFRADLVVNEQFLPWMWPGLILIGGLCVLPILSLYKTK